MSINKSLINSFFLDNKYTKWYFQIIENANSKGRIKLKRNNAHYIYYEAHHIIPKCLSPEYESFIKYPWNKVLLTAREHFICHRLLTKMATENRHTELLDFACSALTNGFGKNKDRYNFKISSNTYQYLKDKKSKLMSARMSGENNPAKRPDVKLKLGITGDKNPAKRLEVREKISRTRLERGIKTKSIPCSDEKKEKLRKANLGKSCPEMTKQKNRIHGKNKIWIKKLGEASKHIHKDDLEKFISLGWSKGRRL